MVGVEGVAVEADVFRPIDFDRERLVEPTDLDLDRFVLDPTDVDRGRLTISPCACETIDSARLTCLGGASFFIVAASQSCS